MSYEKEFFMVTYVRNLKKLSQKELRQICRESLILFFNKSSMVENFVKTKNLDIKQSLGEKMQHVKTLDDLENKNFEELFDVALNTMKSILRLDGIFLNEINGNNK